VDALSHALVAWILFSAAGLTPLLPFAILGAVIMDADIFFSFISDTDPSLYLFTHGGIAHSFAGAVVLSVLAYGVIVVLLLAGMIPVPALAGIGLWGFAAVLIGACLHLAIDFLACPGIPLLAPFADRKYTAGILPGPSILLAFAALGLVVVTVVRIVELSAASSIYSGIVVLYLAVRGDFFLIAGNRIHGRKVPTVNPFRWLAISEDAEHCTVREYTLFRGLTGESVYSRFRDTSAEEVKSMVRFPEVRRLLFNSSCVIAERTGSGLVLSDPLREHGYLYYPPRYKRVIVPIKDQT
jgi:inner membrane protein